MNINKLAMLANKLLKKASEEEDEDLDYEKVDKYANFFADFINIPESHPKYEIAKNKIKSLLKESKEAQEAFDTSFGAALHNGIPSKNLQQKLNDFIPFLNNNLKTEMIGWLNKEYAKNYLNDENPKIREIVERTLGISIEDKKGYEHLFINPLNELEEKEESLPIKPLPKKEPTDKDRKQLQGLLNELKFQFGDKDPKAN